MANSKAHSGDMNQKCKGKGNRRPDSKTNRKSKGSKGSKTFKCDECGADVTFSDSKQEPNDVSWYAANPQLLTDAASLAFGTPLGAHREMRATQDIGSAVMDSFDFVVPGLMSIDLAPCAGYANTWTDPVNIAARNIYSFVRHANSGHSNYDAPDLMYYILAADSVYSAWAFLARTYGLLRAYSVYNRYWPAAVVGSAGIDFPSASQNMADFRYRLNQLAVKASSICVPRDITLFARHSWMYSNVYLDDPGIKGQAYVFNPRYFYKYTITEQNATLEPVIMHHQDGRLTRYEDVLNLIESMLDAMLVNEDMNIMSGDILKAYGQENLWRLASIPEDYLVTPVYNAEVLNQIHNATIFNVTDEEVQAWNISQDMTEGSNRGCLIFKPMLNINDSNVQLLYPHIMDMPMDAPTPADVMVGSRLMVGGTRTKDDLTHIKLQIFGTEIPANCYVWTTTRDGLFTGKSFWIANDERTVFNNGPIKRLTYNNAEHNLVGMYGYSGMLNNYTVVEPYVLDRMHGVAQLSELSIPQMATFK